MFIHLSSITLIAIAVKVTPTDARLLYLLDLVFNGMVSNTSSRDDKAHLATGVAGRTGVTGWAAFAHGCGRYRETETRVACMWLLIVW